MLNALPKDVRIVNRDKFRIYNRRSDVHGWLEGPDAPLLEITAILKIMGALSKLLKSSSPDENRRAAVIGRGIYMDRQGHMDFFQF